jgi:iron complex transport system ATP-binding protein
MGLMAAVRTERVGVQAGSRWLLRDISLDVNPGEIVALVGPNGAGKSTLLATLAGDIAPTTGSVFIGDREIQTIRPKELALRRAVLPQQTVIQFAFTVREVVAMGRSARANPLEDEQVVSRMLEMVDALQLGSRIYPSLSVGEQARVSLARVLAQETEVLLLDEPTAALDLRHQQLVMTLSRELATRGTAIVVILHDLNLAAAFADRIVLLREGMIMADGAPEQTLDESLLSAVFECPIVVTKHPLTGNPLVLPVANQPAGVTSRDERSLSRIDR